MKSFVTAFILVLLSVTLFAHPVLAKGSPREQTVVILPKEETVNKDYFAAGDTVRVSGTVNGDAYVAGGSVVVDGIINGDLFVAGGTVEISGPVKNDLRAAGGVVTVASTIGGNMTLGAGTAMLQPKAKLAGSLLAGAGSLTVYSPVGRGITAGAGTLVINSTVGGDIRLAVEELSLLPKARVAGDLTYWSETEASIADNVALSGELIYNKVAESDAKPTQIARGGIQGAVGALAGMAAAVAVINITAMFILGLILMSLFPTFSKNTVLMIQKNPWGAFGLGLVSVIALPVLGIAAIMTVIGIPVGIFFFVAVGLLCVLAHLYAALFIGNGIFRKLNADVHRAWQLLAGLIILGIFTLIPILGWLARGIFVLMGAGALLFEKQAVYRQMKTKHLI